MYRILESGIEAEYFNIILENVKFTTVAPFLSPNGMSSTHLETLELRYEAITWKYTEGNIIYRDSWNDRCCAWSRRKSIAHAKDCKKTDVVIEKFGDGAAEHNSFRGAGSVELPAAGLGSLNYLLYVELLAKNHPNIPLIIEHVDESDIPRAKNFVDDVLMVTGT